MALLLLYRMGHGREKIKGETEQKEGGSEVNTDRGRMRMSESPFTLEAIMSDLTV